MGFDKEKNQKGFAPRPMMKFEFAEIIPAITYFVSTAAAAVDAAIVVSSAAAIFLPHFMYVLLLSIAK